MPHPTDKYDADTLPDPELNPLLNPLLAAHMGRWAEVYFTNPPEKRGEAVSQLLRELENGSPAETASLQTIPDESAKETTETVESPDSTPTTLPSVLTCSACAYENSAGQRFCGMCGKPLHVSPEAHMGQFAEAAPVAGGSWCERSLGGNFVEDGVQHTSDPAVRSTLPAVGGYDTLEPTWPLPENHPLHFGVESEPHPYRYRLYVGAVLAILLAVLGYMAWRGKEALSDASAPQSAPSRAISESHPAPAASTQPSATGTALPASTPPAAPVQDRPDASLQTDQTADSQPAPKIVPVTAGSSVVAVAPSGAEELAMAEKYLNGTSGTTRDSGEAAQWLWKAVRKQNLEATLALSDLYLRGDGVPKNCDQARLLLDAAARKGGKAAAERLRNLQAFGCE